MVGGSQLSPSDHAAHLDEVQVGKLPIIRAALQRNCGPEVSDEAENNGERTK